MKFPALENEMSKSNERIGLSCDVIFAIMANNPFRRDFQNLNNKLDPELSDKFFLTNPTKPKNGLGPEEDDGKSFLYFLI